MGLESGQPGGVERIGRIETQNGDRTTSSNRSSSSKVKIRLAANSILGQIDCRTGWIGDLDELQIVVSDQRINRQRRGARIGRVIIDFIEDHRAGCVGAIGTTKRSRSKSR